MVSINPEYEVDKITVFLRRLAVITGIKNVVIGWSGGIDSTVCLFLLARALPSEHIHLLHMPYSRSYIKELKGLKAKGLKILEKNIHEEDIKEMVDTIWDINSKLKIQSSKQTQNSNSENKIRLGNIMARVRMITLFDTAKRIHGLVCGTENKTEHELGYFTRYGDGASDIEPIQHLYKTQVYALAEYLQVPSQYIDRAPSANLWEGQTDEGEFGFSYKEADEVLYRYIDISKTIKEIETDGLKNAKKIIAFMKRNEFKRKVPYVI
jgi:NAD+ synthase